MDPRLVTALALAACASCGILLWLWIGRARGGVKRAGYRILLFTVALFLVAVGRAQGLFARASLPFDLALAVTISLVVVGNLYSVRFCSRCGRMHRNFKTAICARCGATLSRHGFTDEPRRPPLDPLDPLGRKRAARTSR